ncbi:OmpA family protein [Yoonia tamlensis]|uniref:OmpA family protein n=1 Tax=Yoonia tamlensis TaxID=390270 RepID=A0A1I6I031_9RHOB|nr:OmpA family protein [Yoonia tamlensis]SFR60019.1 OmpA family protein [Yoonia tamlensis]
MWDSITIGSCRSNLLNRLLRATTIQRANRGIAGLALACAFATGACAQSLQFPNNAHQQFQAVVAIDSYAMPVDIWANGVLPVEIVEGMVTKQAWRIDAQALTTLQLLRPLREQLRDDRYQIIFECQTEACGGFDFRFGTPTLPPPEMQINIGDFRFLSARRIGAQGPEYLTLLVSRTAQAGFVQLVHVGPELAEAPVVAVAEGAALTRGAPTSSGSLADQLAASGHAILADLTFETGSSQLAAGDMQSLRALADYLADNPDRDVALVGHTDASGSLDANIALSKRRAGSVLERLVTDYGVARAQLAAEGMGYLSPIASNLTEEGRQENRRVEVIVVSTSE